MSIEINLLQASVTALCTFFPEHIFSAVGKDFWLFANGGFKCDCRVSVGSHIARGFELEISLAKNYVWLTAAWRTQLSRRRESECRGRRLSKERESPDTQRGLSRCRPALRRLC